MFPFSITKKSNFPPYLATKIFKKYSDLIFGSISPAYTIMDIFGKIRKPFANYAKVLKEKLGAYKKRVLISSILADVCNAAYCTGCNKMICKGSKSHFPATISGAVFCIV